ncbi:carbohydrate sulfotransferase 8 [Protopterus annectens]|uniref:carbohydrate sulfotransferase 8 n=1 Tax=Protopterus annectens TaxID=7888 RepID=UPI001CFBA55A|nr:carbohydrate sulfotransferase 8 [Protopterus annectens]
MLFVFSVGSKIRITPQQPKQDCVSSKQHMTTKDDSAFGLLMENNEVSLLPPPISPTLFHGISGREKAPLTSKIIKRNENEMNTIKLHKNSRRLLIKRNPFTASSVNSTLPIPVRKFEGYDDVLESFYETQRQRKLLMRDTCLKYKSNSRKSITPHHVSRIFVEDRHKMLYCEIPKAGCSNWKRVLMVLNGLAHSTSEIKHNTVHYGNYLKRLDSFDQKGIYHRLSSYTKVLFVREPFERLVSAFRDKFEHPNSYYHPVFGKAIISKYRVNATQEALRTGSGVMFKEFIQYLLDFRRPVGMDIHWEHVNRLCSPCVIDYDFIGKFESIEKDANFLLYLIGAPKNLTFPRFKDRHSNEERTTTKITHQYFAQLSLSERQRAYDFYYMDYIMFNYSKPFKDLY